MARFRNLLGFATLLGAALLASEALIVARTPSIDWFHVGVALFAYVTSRFNVAVCIFPASVLTFYLGILSWATGWDARPLALNAVWAVFSGVAMVGGLLAFLCCCSSEPKGEDDDNEGEVRESTRESDGEKDKARPKKGKTKKKGRKAGGIVVGLVIAGAVGAMLYLNGQKWLYMAREKMATPGPMATSWRPRFQPLAWPEAEQKATDVLRRMTDPEKYSLLRGYGWQTGIMAGMEPIYGTYTGNTPAIPHLGIPSLNMQDAANGYRTFADVPIGTSTSWPSLLALGATWDAPLVEEVAAAIAREFRGKGANVLLGPSIQVHRTVWGGRNFEYMSGEDPYLGSVMARAYVRGVQSEGVMAVAKHWAFNEQETNRFEYNVNVDKRTAWELYYPPFQAAVEEGVCAFMCAYNRVNGTHSCTSDGILVHDLKEAMGFRGFVQSDWGATYQYGRAIEHGLDQDMPGNDNLFTDEQLRTIKPLALNEAVRRVLTAVYRMRLDENSWCTPPNCISERLSDQHTMSHRLLAQSVATKAVVLLKNDGILPLQRKNVSRVAVLGPAADARCSATETDMGKCMSYFGGGSGMVIPGNAVTPLHGITMRAQTEGITIVPCSDLKSVTASVNAAVMADVVVVVGATTATEFVDRDVIHKDLMMAEDVDSIISTVAAYKPTIVLMQTPGAVVMPWLDKVKAVANLFLAGEETGTAWASMLFGDASPEGKLTVQFPKSLKDTIRNTYDRHFEYSEGLFTSYRNPQMEYSFPFGHGLSYTSFEYGVPEQVNATCAAKVCVSLSITNVGSRPGAEVVQAYLEFEGAAKTPSRILRGFFKTRVLKPGESQSALLNFTAKDLSLYSVESSGWELQHLVKAHIGASSADIRRHLNITEILALHRPHPAPPAQEESAAPVPTTTPPVALHRPHPAPPAQEESAAPVPTTTPPVASHEEAAPASEHSSQPAKESTTEAPPSTSATGAAAQAARKKARRAKPSSAVPAEL